MLLFINTGAQPFVLSGSQGLMHPFPLFLNNAVFFADESGKMTVEYASAQDYHPFSYYFSKVPEHLPPDKNWWMRVEIKNELSTDTAVVFYPGFQNFVTAWHVAGGRFTRVGQCGNIVPASQLSIPHFRQALLLPVGALQTNTFFIRIRNVTTFQVDAFKPYLMSRATLSEVQEKLLRGNRIPDYLFFTGLGMFLIMLIYILIKWLYQQDMTYLYYGITIFGSMIYFLFNYFKEQNNQYWFAENPLLLHLINDSFIYLSMFAYWRFVRKFLYLDKEKIFISRYLLYGSNVILILGIISLVYAFAAQHISGIIRVNSLTGVVILLGGVYVLIGIRKINQPLRRFIYGGITSLFIFYSLGSVHEMVRDTPYAFLPSLRSGTPLLMIGNVFEMLFFTVGLAYRNKLEAEQMAGIGVQKAAAEMKALRAQMNPHFIFNCMNTIDAYIFKEQPEKASAFLNTFSRLIRQTLENSQHTLISIDKEIELLRLYTQLEQERFDHSFTADFILPAAVSGQQYKIPPLLLQPYVENAIQHGLRHLPFGNGEQKGSLTIWLADSGEKIDIRITDTGIGRQAAEEIYKTNGRAPHQSMALALTRQRLELLPGGGWVEINNHPDAGQTGTEVTIHLPKLH